ncbi:MAG: hypothetical protein V4787_19575 [Pseudomonadota bacterium]
MSISSLNSTRPAYSVADSGDPLAVLREAFMNLNNELRQGLTAVSAEAQKAMADYAALQKAGLGKRVHGLTLTDDGTRYILGAPAAAQALLDDLSASGISLATQTAYGVTVESRDAQGKLLSTSHLLGTPEVLDEIFKATIANGRDGGGDGYNVRYLFVNNADGGTDRYAIDYGDATILANKADVDAIGTGIDAKETELLSVIDREMRRLTDMSAELIERMRASERQHVQGRKDEDDGTVQRMQDMLRDIQKAIEERFKEISPTGVMP